MTDQSLTAIALMQQQENRELRAAMCRLLNDLRDYMAAYPRDRSAKMPEHDICWLAYYYLAK